MAGTATSVYLTIVPKGKLQSVFKRVFFTATDFNKFVQSEEFKEKYPKTEFEIIKEVY
jgi:hypothetical protein